MGTPATLEEVTPDWLTEVLRAGGTLGADQRVVSVRAASHAGGIAVTSRVARLLLTIEPDAGSAPTSLFVKVRNPDWGGSPEGYGLEVRFYRELASALELPVPRCYHAELDPDTESGRFVLLLEDLTDRQPGHADGGLDAGQCERVLSDLARLQGAWWGGARLEAGGWPRMGFDAERTLYWAGRFEAAWEGMREGGGYTTDAAARAAYDALDAPALLAAREGLTRGPHTLVHADLHTQNLLLDGAGPALRVWFIDWQDPSIGNPAWDFAYVLGCNTRPDVQRGAGRRLLDGYLGALRAHAGVTYDTRDALGDYAASCVWQAAMQIVFLAGYEAENDAEHEALQLELDRVAHSLVTRDDWMA